MALSAALLRDPPPLSVIRAARTRREVDRAKNEIAKAGRLLLRTYVQLAWHVLEPTRPFKPNWHIDAICEHLEAVEAADLTRLAIAMPPGCMKSLLCGVFFPTHIWGPGGNPAARFLGFADDMKLSTRDAIKSRRLITSDWYQSLWGDRYKLVDDQNQKTRYENDQTGFRISDYVGGGTGERGDFITIDDPHEVSDALTFSTDLRQLERASYWLHETLPSRVNDPETSAIVVVHHRIHQKDMIGDILKSNMGYDYLCLPMEYDPERPSKTKIGWRDPRKIKGELLFEARFPRAVVDKLKSDLTPFAVNGQLQQNPQPREGSVIKRHWFEIVGAAPADCQWVRYWDLAGTKDRGAWTAGVLMGRSRSSKMFFIQDIKRERIEGDSVRKLIKQTAALDYVQYHRTYTVGLPQDPGQAGKIQGKDYTISLAGYNVIVEIESGDKLTRAQPFADQAEAGNVKLVSGLWIEPFLAEAVTFPGGDFKDQIDACSGAFGILITHIRGRIVTQAVTGHS
jgi:predicted phage terminase large subunit-like protein